MLIEMGSDFVIESIGDMVLYYNFTGELVQHYSVWFASYIYKNPQEIFE